MLKHIGTVTQNIFLKNKNKNRILYKWSFQQKDMGSRRKKMISSFKTAAVSNNYKTRYRNQIEK